MAQREYSEMRYDEGIFFSPERSVKGDSSVYASFILPGSRIYVLYYSEFKLRKVPHSSEILNKS